MMLFTEKLELQIVAYHPLRRITVAWIRRGMALGQKQWPEPTTDTDGVPFGVRFGFT